MTDSYLVLGCPNASPIATPCTEVIWTVPSAMLIVAGVPALTNVSVGLARSAAGAISGPAMVLAHQTSYEEPYELTLVD